MDPNLIASGTATFLLIVKFGIILFLIIYVIFAAVVIKQVRMMTDTLDLSFEGQIKFIVFIHFIFSLTVLILSIFIL